MMQFLEFYVAHPEIGTFVTLVGAIVVVSVAQAIGGVFRR